MAKEYALCAWVGAVRAPARVCAVVAVAVAGRGYTPQP